MCKREKKSSELETKTIGNENHNTFVVADVQYFLGVFFYEYDDNTDDGGLKVNSLFVLSIERARIVSV